MPFDVHTHVVPYDFPLKPASSAERRWPSMQAGGDCGHRSVMIDGRAFRTVSSDCWDAGRRIEAMDRCGITAQALSPMPELLSYWFAPDDAVEFAAAMN